MALSSPGRFTGDTEGAGRARLLIVDDSESMRRQVTELLADEFQIVGVLGDGDHLDAAVGEGQADLVVLDVGLPGQNGLVLARDVIDKHPGVRVVMLTLHDDPDYVRVALTAGALGYVLKHRLGSDLVPAVRSALTGRRFLSCGVRLDDRE